LRHGTIIEPALFSIVGLVSQQPQRRQSVKLFLQSSELGPTLPLTRRRVCPPRFRGGEVRGCKRGGGGVPIRTRGQTLWYSPYISMYFVPSHSTCLLIQRQWLPPILRIVKRCGRFFKNG